MEAEILELAANERLVLAWTYREPHTAIGFPTRLSLGFEQLAGGGTTLNLVHDQLSSLSARLPDVAGNIAAGWSTLLDNLDTI